MGKKICIDSGVLRVASGGSGAKAPPLAAHPNNTIRMQNQAKLAAGAHRGHIAKQMSKCLH